MSSPHIAGMAALVKEVHPDWSAAMVKSALMTTARQNLTKENGVTPADPFDFGAGHAVPNKATQPGLTYDIANNDYFAFLCGIGNSSFVANTTGVTCAQFEAAGYDTDPSQLNLPSMAIAELTGAETLTRVVTDVSGSGSVYTATVEAPAAVAEAAPEVVAAPADVAPVVVEVAAEAVPETAAVAEVVEVAAPVIAGGRAPNDPREVRRRQREAERLAQEAAQAPVASIEVAAAPEAEVAVAVEAPASANVDSEPAAVVETAPAAETAAEAEANTASAAEVQQAEEVKPLA